MARRKYGEGDVCERRRGRMKRAKRSGSNLGCGEQTTACEDRALVTTGGKVNYGQ